MVGPMSNGRRISRRRVLQTLGVGSAVGMAGCIGGGTGGCQDFSIDLSTGTTDGTPDSFGTDDPDWRVVSAPDGTTGQAVSIEPVSQWVTLSTANWVDPYGTGGWPAPADPLGAYVYEIDFEVGETWSEERCELRIHQWSVDDDATLELDGPSGTVTLDQDSGHTSLKGPVYQSLAPGQYTLRARVNNSMTITGLLVEADVLCECDDEPPAEGCDLSIRKTHAGDGNPVAAGETTTFEITVCNDGDGTCRPDPVTVVDELPTGLSYVSDSGSGWSCTETGGVVTCEHPQSGGLAPGDCLPTLTLEVELEERDEPTETIVNCATVEQGNAGAPNKRDCAEIPVLVDEDDEDGDEPCDLILTKTHEETYVSPGTTTDFEITVCNEGDQRCRGAVSVVDSLPSGVTFVSASGNGWSTSETGGVVTSEHQNSSGLAGGDCLPPITIEVEIGSMDETGDAIRNCASIKYEDADPDTNRDCVDVPVRPETSDCDGLDITKTTGEQFVYGQEATYEIEVCNLTESTCEGRLSVTDTLPNGISFVSASGSGWTASVSGGTVTAVHANSGGLGAGACLPLLTLIVEVAPVDRFPSGSDGVRNCARVFADGTVIDEDCVSHTVTRE